MSRQVQKKKITTLTTITPEVALKTHLAKMGEMKLGSIPGFGNGEEPNPDCPRVCICEASVVLFKKKKWKLCCEVRTCNETGCDLETEIYQGDVFKSKFVATVCSKIRCYVEITGKLKVNFGELCEGDFRGVILQLFAGTSCEGALLHTSAIAIEEGVDCINFTGVASLTPEQCAAFEGANPEEPLNLTLVAINDCHVDCEILSVGDVEEIDFDCEYQLDQDVIETEGECEDPVDPVDPVGPVVEPPKLSTKKLARGTNGFFLHTPRGPIGSITGIIASHTTLKKLGKALKNEDCEDCDDCCEGERYTVEDCVPHEVDINLVSVCGCNGDTGEYILKHTLYTYCASLITCNTMTTKECKSTLKVTCIPIKVEVEIEEATSDMDGGWKMCLFDNNPCIEHICHHKDEESCGELEYKLDLDKTVDHTLIDCLHLKAKVILTACDVACCRKQLLALTYKLCVKTQGVDGGYICETVQGETDIPVDPLEDYFGLDNLVICKYIELDLTDDINLVRKLTEDSEICVEATATFQNHCVNASVESSGCEDCGDCPPGEGECCQELDTTECTSEVCAPIDVNVAAEPICVSMEVAEICENCTSDKITAEVCYYDTETDPEQPTWVEFKPGDECVEFSDDRTKTEEEDNRVCIRVKVCYNDVILPPLAAIENLTGVSLKEGGGDECDDCSTKTTECGIFVLKVTGTYKDCDGEEDEEGNGNGNGEEGDIVLHDHASQSVVVWICEDPVLVDALNVFNTTSLMWNDDAHSAVNTSLATINPRMSNSATPSLKPHKNPAVFEYGTKHAISFTHGSEISKITGTDSTQELQKSSVNPKQLSSAVRAGLSLRLNVLHSSIAHGEKLGKKVFTHMERFSGRNMGQLNGKTISEVDTEFEKYLSGDECSIKGIDSNMVVAVFELISTAYSGRVTTEATYFK